MPAAGIKRAAENWGGGSNGPQQASRSAPQDPQSQQQPQDSPELPRVWSGPTPAQSGGFGEVLDAASEDGQPASQAELSPQVHGWAINGEQALCSARACGREPGGIERRLEQTLQSENDWRAILRDFIAATNPSDYRWRRRQETAEEDRRV